MSLFARVPAPVRRYLDSWKFWNLVAFGGIVVAMVLGFYALASQNRQAEQSRKDLCGSVNGTRTVIRQILEASEAQAVAAGANKAKLSGYYGPLIALAHPVDCSEVVTG